MSPDAESMNLLREARAKAGSLLEQLRRKQAELDASPPSIDRERLAQGQLAMQKAVEAASRTVSSLDDAIRVAAISSN
jgi:hypothetical protein